VILLLLLLLLSSSSSSSSSSTTTSSYCFLSQTCFLQYFSKNRQLSPPLKLQVSVCSTFCIMCDVTSTAVYCIESIECFPFLYFLTCFIYSWLTFIGYSITLCRRVGHLIKYPLVPGRFKCFECSTQ